METLKDMQDSGKGESLFRHIVSFLVIGIYSDTSNITGFSPYLEIESFGLPWSLWTMVHFKGTLIPCMLLKCS